MKTRQIRFRAWHIEEKKMCEVETLTRDGAFLIGVKPGRDQIFDNGKWITFAPEDGRFCKNEEFHLMQYTGISDTKGRRIYEGDIIKHANGLGVVKYERGMFLYDYEYFKEKNPVLMISGGLYWDTLIGNVYENPELLTK